MTDATYQNMGKLCNAVFFFLINKIAVKPGFDCMIDPLSNFSVQLFSFVRVVTLYPCIAS